MNRLRYAWLVLRGRGIIYRCALALDGDKLYVASLHGGKITIAQNGIGPWLVLPMPGEVAVIDWGNGMVYPLHVEERTP